MNDYYEIGKNALGKKIVSIKCNQCEKRFEVRKQTAHTTRLYYCRNCSRTGKRNGMYGKGYLISGERNGNFNGLSEQHKRNLSLSRTGLKLNLSDELRLKKRKIGGDNLKKWMTENPDKHKQTSRKGGINSLKIQSDYGRISSIEKKTIDWLKNKNIQYEFQFNIDNKFLYDFKIGNFIIEVNGSWFHSLPEQVIKDRVKKELAEERGYTLIYIWENEINSGDFSKLEEILC
jgi:very-short-patch-repair endonuclease